LQAMKVLLFEYISSGGFANQPLTAGLAGEGRLMLQALLDDFTDVPGVDVRVMLDGRLVDGVVANGTDIAVIGPGQDYFQTFLELARDCDAVWPVAPESDGLLQRLCQTVTDLGKTLLTSPAAAVALTGDKYQTYRHLCKHGIATVPTRLLAEVEPEPGEWIVKAIDGVGCEDSRIVSDLGDFVASVPDRNRFIVQPHLQGQKTSLSGLFKQGQAWLLSVNLQEFTVLDSQYHLTSIIVNHSADDGGYLQLLQRIAAAFPDLWGYAGVDLIETESERLVLEINPRLTTSYTGLNRALGVNIADSVLQLLQGRPSLRFTRKQTVRITL